MQSPFRWLIFAAGLAAAVYFAFPASIGAAEPVAPFGFGIGTFTYEETLRLLDAKDWSHTEYEKKHFKTVGPEASQRGKNTFLRVTPRQMAGVKGLLMFLNSDRMLQAMLVNLEPNLFAATMAELDDKYPLVKKKLQGESFSSDHPFVLYEQGDVYIELQMYSPHSVRILYTQKYMWENYREFLQKDYEPFRSRQNREGWMKDL